MNRAYIYLTWIATVVGAPFLIAIYSMIFGKGSSNSDAWELFPFVLFFGLFLSLPSLGIYVLFFELLKNKVLSANIMRFMLLLLSVFLISISFWLLGGSLALWLATAYVLASVLASLVFWRRLSS